VRWVVRQPERGKPLGVEAQGVAGHLSFYEATAQILPVMYLAFIVSAPRVTWGIRELKTYQRVSALCTVLFMAAEGAALWAVFHGAGNATTLVLTLVGYALALGYAVLLGATLDPRP
jgi:hypothetical protein